MKSNRGKRFKRLRAELSAIDIDAEYLAELLGRENRYYIERRLRAEYPWDLTEMYQIMEILRWPIERMPELFPKNGQDAVPKFVRVDASQSSVSSVRQLRTAP